MESAALRAPSAIRDTGRVRANSRGAVARGDRRAGIPEPFRSPPSGARDQPASSRTSSCPRRSDPESRRSRLRLTRSVRSRQRIDAPVAFRKTANVDDASAVHRQRRGCRSSRAVPQRRRRFHSSATSRRRPARCCRRSRAPARLARSRGARFACRLTTGTGTRVSDVAERANLRGELRRNIRHRKHVALERIGNGAPVDVTRGACASTSSKNRRAALPRTAAARSARGTDSPSATRTVVPSSAGGIGGSVLCERASNARAFAALNVNAVVAGRHREERMNGAEMRRQDRRAQQR